MRHDKLVRDRIPEILAARGVRAELRRVEPGERSERLRAKLAEEVAEHAAATDRESRLEELADVLEVVLALAADEGADAPALEARRARKAADRGGFADGWVLLTTEEPARPA